MVLPLFYWGEVIDTQHLLLCRYMMIQHAHHVITTIKSSTSITHTYYGYFFLHLLFSFCHSVATDCNPMKWCILLCLPSSPKLMSICRVITSFSFCRIFQQWSFPMSQLFPWGQVLGFSQHHLQIPSEWTVDFSPRLGGLHSQFKSTDSSPHSPTLIWPYAKHSLD